MDTIKIFISSPGDVAEERAISAKVIKRLSREFSHRVLIEPIFWEHEPLRASASFQDEILLPSETDIVISILWTRLGSRLPKRFKFDGDEAAPTGTEFEIRDAIKAFKEFGHPDLLIYKKTAEPLISLKDEELVKKSLQQKKQLEQFTQHFFFDEEDNTIKAAFHCFEKSSTFEQTLEEHLRKLIDRKAPPGAAEIEHVASWTSGSPFRGLQRFDIEHAPIFFGRSKAISDVMTQLKAKAVTGQNFILIQGMSGSGKSSLVCAGVLPLIMEPGVIEGIGIWRYAITKPSDADDLFKSLAVALTAEHALPELLSDGTTIDEIVDSLTYSKSIVPLVRGALRQISSNCRIKEELEDDPKSRLVLVLDQMEEIFTKESISKEERQKFFDIVKILAESGLVWIIGTLRSDFYHRCEDIPALMELKEGQGQYHLQPPSAPEFSQMIRLPASAANLKFEKKADGTQLDEVILEQALESPEALPLLEFCLEELYEVGHEDKLLSFENYKQIGKFEGALSRKANQVLNSLPEDAKATLPSIMRRLVTIEEDSAVRRWYSEEKLKKIPGAEKLLNEFKNARLLVSRGKDNESYLSITHEVLLRNWPLMTQLIERDREFLLLRGRVEQSAQQWLHQNKDVSYLLPHGRALNEALSLYEERKDDLDQQLIEYIQISKAQEQKASRLKKLLLAAAILTLSCFTAFALFMWSKASSNEQIAVQKKEEAEKQEKIAEAEKVKAQEQRNIAEAQKAKAEKLVLDLEKSSNALKKIITDELDNIHLYVLQKDYAKVEKLLTEKPELVNKGTSLGVKPIHFAAQTGDKQMIELLVKYKADLSLKSSSDNSVYHYSALSGSADILLLLLKYQTGFDVNNKNPEGKSASATTQTNQRADQTNQGQENTETENTPVTKHITKFASFIDQKNFEGETPLHWAVRSKNFAMLETMSSLGAAIDTLDNNQHSPLFYAVMRKNYNPKVLKHLLDNLGHLDTLDKGGNTILHHTAIHGNTSSLKDILGNYRVRRLINKLNLSSRSALHLACLYNTPEFTEELIETGAPDLSIKDKEGFTAIIDAASSGKLEIIKLLQKKGVSLGEIHSGWSLLGRAAMNGHLNVVKFLVDQNSDTSFRNKGITALHLAAENGHLEVVKFLADKGADIKTQDYYGYTPFMGACRHGHLETAQYLLSKGADINKQDSAKNSPITFAAGFGHIEVAKFLTLNKADINHQDDYGYNALLYACSLEKFDLAKLLIEKGADINKATNQGDNALMFAARKGQLELLKLLASKGANTKQLTSNGNHALIEASYRGNLDVVKELVKMGLPVNHTSKINYTALMFAAQEGHLDIVKYLIENGADIKVKGKSNFTAFMAAASAGQMDVVKFLVDIGADISVKSTSGWTALFYVAQDGNNELLKFLIDKGIDVNAISKNGYNALMAAADYGQNETVKILIDKGVNISLKDTDGYDALLGAVEKGHLETVKLLIENGASLKTKTISNFTPLMTAANTGKTQVVKYLLSLGVEIDETNNGWTALFYAATKGYLDTVQLLVNSGANLNHRSPKGRNLIIETAYKGHTAVVEYLLRKKMSPNSIDYEGVTPLIFASQSGHLEMAKLLWRYGAAMDYADAYGYDSMLAAINSGNIELIKYLISKGVSMYNERKNGYTPLTWACQKGKLTVVQFFNENQIPLNTVPKNEFNALMAACSGGSLETVKYLVEHGLKVNYQRTDGYTPLLFACEKGYLDIVSYLISKGADSSLKYKTGYNVITASVNGGNIELLKYFVNRGESLKIRLANGYTPLHYACSKGYLDIVKYLLTKGASLKDVTSQKSNALTLAAISGNVELIKFLLAQGMDVNYTDDIGYTALFWACEKGNFDVAQFLLNSGAKHNIESTNGYNTMMATAYSGNVALMRLLMSKGMKLDVKDKTGYTILMYACERLNIDMVKFLVRNGINVNARDSKGTTAMDIAKKYKWYELEDIPKKASVGF